MLVPEPFDVLQTAWAWVTTYFTPGLLIMAAFGVAFALVRLWKIWTG